LVKAGSPVDKVINSLKPHLEQGDIIIDGGNSFFQDTERRHDLLSQQGFLYLGMGISGGEYGALHGPSIMPGGSKEAYSEIKEIFTAIAAKTEDGPCVTYLGPGASGHYVKMVHNGIEYAVMEIIAEIYYMMRKVLKLTPFEMSKLFREWNREHKSYLLEITHKILDTEDEESGKPLIDIILDRSRQKGTGKWTVDESMNLGVPTPTIVAGVNARYLSASKGEREKIAASFEPETKGNNTTITVEDEEKMIADMHDSLYLAIVIAYAEGMKLLQIASEEYSLGLDLQEVARIWEDGCIIRSALLKPIQQAYHENPDLINLIISGRFVEKFKTRVDSWRCIVTQAGKLGIPVPALSSALTYFDSLKSEKLPANMIQAQRDYFGAHTYEKIDKEGQFHTEWQDIHNIT